MTSRRARAAALLAAAALSPGALSACGSNDPEPGSSIPSGPSVAASQPFNGADVAFATAMVQHHAQALTMVDLTRDRDLGPRVQRLAQEILEAQGPEIQTMTGWLQDWHRPVPETMRDHVNAEDEGGMGGMRTDSASGSGSDLPGMMSEREMSALESASDADFESRWLRLMIEHHRGAVEMARSEQARGEYADAKALAGTIVRDQEHEITRMKALLAG